MDLRWTPKTHCKREELICLWGVACIHAHAHTHTFIATDRSVQLISLALLRKEDTVYQAIEKLSNQHELKNKKTSSSPIHSPTFIPSTS